MCFCEIIKMKTINCNYKNIVNYFNRTFIYLEKVVLLVGTFFGNLSVLLF